VASHLAYTVMHVQLYYEIFTYTVKSILMGIGYAGWKRLHLYKAPPNQPSHSVRVFKFVYYYRPAYNPVDTDGPDEPNEARLIAYRLKLFELP